jgi:hypothetical protein
MKKAFLCVFLFPLATAVAQTQSPAPVQPVTFHSPHDSPALSIEEERRFLACENTGGTGFYWLDTTNGNLWKLDPDGMEWRFLGEPRGAQASRNGTYTLLSDRTGGVYVLNTDNGEGWWTDGVEWKRIGELSRRVKKAE